MKKYRFILLFSCLSVGVGIMMGAYDYDPIYPGSYLPVFMLRGEMEKAVKAESPQGMKNPGKIYIYGDYILVNEKYKGIHIIDNHNPESPQNIAFLHIDGCMDMAVKDNLIYTDNAVDLIAIKPNASYTSIEVTERLAGLFPELPSPEGTWLSYGINDYRPKGGILVAWKMKPNNK